MKPAAKIAALAMSLVAFAAIAQYLNTSLDIESPEAVILDAFSAGNTIQIEFALKDAGSAYSPGSGWGAYFHYSRDQQATEGGYRIPAAITNSTVSVMATNTIPRAGDWYWSLVGTNSSGVVRTWGRGVLKTPYDPGADETTIVLDPTRVLNFDRYVESGTLSNVTIIGTIDGLSTQIAAEVASYLTENPPVGDGTNDLIATAVDVVGAIDGADIEPASVSGDGSGLTGLDGSSITAGTVADARIASTIARATGATYTGTHAFGGATVTGISRLDASDGSPAPALSVNSIGNVGIGTTSPAASLDVAGDAEVSGTVTAEAFAGDGSALTGVRPASTTYVPGADVQGYGTALPEGFGYTYKHDLAIYHDGTDWTSDFVIADYLPAYTNVYYLATDGDDGDNGATWATAKASMTGVRAQIITDGVPDAVVYVADGTYTGKWGNVILTVPCAVLATNAATFYSTTSPAGRSGSGSVSYYRGLTFDAGETASNPFSVTTGDQDDVIYFESCAFVNGTGNGLNSVWGGEIYLADCLATNNLADGFNYHDDSNEVSSKVFELRCVGSNNGDSDPDNGSSIHEEGRIVRVAGVYTNNMRNVHDINDSASALFGCTVHTSRGDDTFSESFNVGAGYYLLPGTTRMWVYGGNVLGGANVDAHVGLGATLYVDTAITNRYVHESGNYAAINHTYRALPATLRLPGSVLSLNAINVGGSLRVANDIFPGADGGGLIGEPGLSWGSATIDDIHTLDLRVYGHAQIDTNLTVGGNVHVNDGVVQASGFSGGGSQITGLSASELASGTVPDARIASTITRDTEWDTAAEINAATTDEDFLVESDVGVAVQAYDADLADLADGSLSGSKVGSGINAANITSGTMATGQLNMATLELWRQARLESAYNDAGIIKSVNDIDTMDFRVFAQKEFDPSLDGGGEFIIWSGNLTSGVNRASGGLYFTKLGNGNGYKAGISGWQYGPDNDSMGLALWSSWSATGSEPMQRGLLVLGRDLVGAQHLTVSNNITSVAGVFTGNGSGLTNLDATDLDEDLVRAGGDTYTGTHDFSAATVTGMSLPGSAITSGTIATNYLPMDHLGGGSGTVDDDVLVNGTGVDTAANFQDTTTIEWALAGANPGTVTAVVASGSIGATQIDESSIEGVLDLADLQGAVTDAQVPNDITLGAAGAFSRTNWTADADTGMTIAGNLTLSIQGDIIADAALLPAGHNTIDIGASGTRWRNIYAATGNITDVQAVGVTADEFVGGGAGLTDLDASELTGTVADARIASTIARDSELPPKVLAIAVSDETSDLTTGTAKATFRMPYAMSLDAVRASLTTAPAGSTVTVDINENGSTILSTKITIDAGEKTSTTAATAPVISDASLADDAEITIDIDAIGASTAGSGLKIYLIDNP